MAEATPSEVAAKADAAFATGFGDTPPAPVEKVVEEAPAEPAKPAAAVPAPKPEKPQYARVLQQDWDNLKAAAGKVGNLESQIAKLSGSTPNAERIAQQVTERLRAQTASGGRVKLSKEDLAELSEDFPELSEKLLLGLTRAFDRADVAATGVTEPGKPEAASAGESLETAVEKALAKREAKQAEEALVRDHPNWGDDVGRPKEAGGEIPKDNPFRLWLATQEPEYRKEVEETQSAAVVNAALTKFKTNQSFEKGFSTPVAPAKPDKAAARRAVIEDAVTPRADGNPPPLNAPESAEDAFAKGFKATKH